MILAKDSAGLFSGQDEDKLAALPKNLMLGPGTIL